MPIIKDPKMNQYVEENYGIIEISDGNYAYYLKETQSNHKRALPWGFEINIDAITLVPDPGSSIVWNGIPITTRAEFDQSNLNPGHQGPITRRIFTYLLNRNNWPRNGTENWTTNVPPHN